MTKTDPLRWGIMTTGNIARQFAESLRGAERSRASAVGSRSIDLARAFAETYEVERACGSYAELLADSDVEAVYLALPNAMHHEWTLKSLRAGKHVLCEKPLARNAAESEEMFDVAESLGRVLVEAFMYRSHPVTHSVMQRIEGGAVGRLRMIRSSFCYCTTNIKNNVRFSRAMAGGALMDIGCYCVNFSRYFARAEPVNINVVAHMHETAVDDVLAGTLQFPGDLIASFTCGMTVHADNTAFLCGSDGYIAVPIPWKPPVNGAQYTVKQCLPPRQDNPKKLAAEPPQTFKIDAGKPLYALEADDFAAVVRDAATPRLTRQDTIENMKVLDEMRRQIGAGV